MQLVVLDEADTLLEKGFKGEVEAVLKPLRSKAQPASVTLVVATFTKVRCQLMCATDRCCSRCTAKPGRPQGPIGFCHARRGHLHKGALPAHVCHGQAVLQHPHCMAWPASAMSVAASLINMQRQDAGALAAKPPQGTARRCAVLRGLPKGCMARLLLCQAASSELMRQACCTAAALASAAETCVQTVATQLCTQTTWPAAQRHSRAGHVQGAERACAAQELRRVLKEQFPEARQVETRSLHRGVPQAHHSFLAMAQGEDRLQRLFLVRLGRLHPADCTAAKQHRPAEASWPWHRAMSACSSCPWWSQAPWSSNLHHSRTCTSTTRPFTADCSATCCGAVHHSYPAAKAHQAAG